MRELPAASTSSAPQFNEAESPLTWLRARRGRDGKPLISVAQYLAGERLRMDFERAMLARRTTLNWDLAGAGARGCNVSAELSDGAIAARQRYHEALDSVGPELASILAQVCCLSAGIEQAERVLDLPARSGRAVLGLALSALARHYGLAEAVRRDGITGWGLDGYRPSLNRPRR